MVSLRDLFVFLSCIGLVYVQGHWSTSSLRLWNDEKELDTKALTIPPGATVGVVCDGSLIGEVPNLAWYGHDKRRIDAEGLAYRVSASISHFGQHRKLTIQDFRKQDEGLYKCLGRSGTSGRWQHTQVRIVLDKHFRPTTEKPTTPVPVVTTTWEVITSRPVQKTTTTEPEVTSPPYTMATTTDQTYANTTEECFLCGSGECVPQSYRCDGYPDCVDSLDEQNCDAGSCTEGTTACRDGNGCVSTDERCDGVAQCSDGSDEDPKICTVN